MGGLFASLVCGASLYVPQRFSATRFWQDTENACATHVLYVGEMMRFVVAKSGIPTCSTIERWVGNGLDSDTWLRLVAAFPQSKIIEFYGATELSALIVNWSGNVGAMGRVPFRAWSRFRIARREEERHEPTESANTAVRAPRREGELGSSDAATSGPVSKGASGERSRWKACAPGEPGELLIEIPRRHFPLLGGFEGYVNRAHESRALLRDVFVKGDLYYRSFDVVYHDADDFFYFVDRAGDLWRHRGHNVSTSWVARRLRECSGVDDCVLIPLRIDASPHRVGLAVVVAAAADAVPLSELERIWKELPTYARPELLAFTRELERTETFKLRRVNYRNLEDLTQFTADTLYRWQERFEPFTVADWPEVRRRLLAEQESPASP
jgi:fatty-acyl-CoA synthase